MKSITLSNLMQCGQLWHELLSKYPVNGSILIVGDEVAEAMAKQYEQAKFEIYSEPPIENRPTQSFDIPIPKEQEWPLWAKALKLVAKPEDKGLGDVIARIVGPIGGDAYKEWFKKTFGRTCGCSERQDFLNSIYPLNL